MANGYWVYPEDYDPPTPPVPHVLTASQRADVKTLMQTYITNQNRRIWSADLIATAQAYILTHYNKAVDYNQLDLIVLEIVSEWGAPE
jgi:hypothetical protein